MEENTHIEDGQRCKASSQLCEIGEPSLKSKEEPCLARKRALTRDHFELGCSSLTAISLTS